MAVKQKSEKRTVGEMPPTAEEAGVTLKEELKVDTKLPWWNNKIETVRDAFIAKRAWVRERVEAAREKGFVEGMLRLSHSMSQSAQEADRINASESTFILQNPQDIDAHEAWRAEWRCGYAKRMRGNSVHGNYCCSSSEFSVEPWAYISQSEAQEMARLLGKDVL